MSSPDRKRTASSHSSTAAAAVVSPEKSAKKLKTEEGHEDEEEHVSAETIMGFLRYPSTSNGDIMKNHYDFVVWAKEKRSEGPTFGRLRDFVEWVESAEGRRLEIESQHMAGRGNGGGNDGDEMFNFGKHTEEKLLRRLHKEIHVIMRGT